MGAIDHTQDPFFATESSKPFKGEPHPGQAHNGVKHRRADLETLLAGSPDNLTEAAFQLIFRDGILKAHFARLQRAMLLQGDDAFLDGAVDRLEVD